MSRLFLVALVASGCTRVMEPPTRAGCTLTTVYQDADGVLISDRTDTFDSEGREVSRVGHVVGEYTYERHRSFDASGCQVEETVENLTDAGDTWFSSTQRTCDTNGDPLTLEYEEVATGRSEYTWGYRTVWTRTYGANGLTSTAVEVQDYGGFAFSSLLSNTYDQKDRPIRQRREENGAVELSSWVYAEGRRFDELVVSEETRDATAMVSQGVYRTFDERGRTVSETERFYADEIVTVTTWDPDRWAEVGMEVSRDGVLDQIIDVDVDDGDPWMARTRAYDGYEGEPDGTVDAVFIETWTCP